DLADACLDRPGAALRARAAAVSTTADLGVARPDRLVGSDTLDRGHARGARRLGQGRTALAVRPRAGGSGAAPRDRFLASADSAWRTPRVMLPVALTIAGSDPSGGGGIQADLRTFAALGVHGASVVSTLTVQDTRQVRGVFAVAPELVRAQLE